MADLETLQIRIKADADTAYKAIDKLAVSLNNLSVSIGRIETGKLNDLASGLDNVSYALKTAKQAVKTSDYTAIFKNFTRLSNIDTARLKNLAGSLNNLASGFTNMTAANSASAYVKDMAAAIAKLGGVKVEAAVTNIPRLESALAHLLTTFSRIPTINQSVIDFVNSLSNLAAQGSHVGPATTSIKNSLESFGTSATKATRKAHSLASVIGTLYAKFWLFARGAKALKNSFVSAADYLEAFNYFDVTARKIGKDTFAKAGVGSAEEYAQAFTETLSEKLRKMSGLELDLEQRLIKTTNAKSLGLNLTELTQYQASIASITNAMGVSQEVAQSTSKVFSMLAGDIGSLRNMDFSQVSQKLQAGLAGQARALYSFGIDITNATLAEYAYAEGITKSVSEMTQAEKAQLRLLAILDQSKVAWGDLANTINSPSNQLRMLQTNLKEVGTVFGQLFIPIMESALPVINGLALAIKQLMVDIAELLGIKLNPDSYGQFGADIDADIESMDELNEAVKETKKGIREFDELKVIGGDKGVGTGVGDQIDLTKQIIEATNEYEKVWDEAYQRMTSKASEIAGYISSAFEPIKRIIEDFHVGDFFKAGEDVSSLVISIFDYFTKAITDVDWDALGKKVGDFLAGVDWTGILSSVGSLIWSAIQGAIDGWTGAFSVAPFETAILTAFGLLKFTGLGTLVKTALVKKIAVYLQKNNITQQDLKKAGLGVASIGIGIAFAIDNVVELKEGKYSVFSLQSLIKSATAALFTGAGFSLIATSIGIASGGLAFALGAAVALTISLAVGSILAPTAADEQKAIVKKMFEWVEESHQDTIDVTTKINLRQGEIDTQFLQIDDLAEKVYDLSLSYDQLTDGEKGLLKYYSDELVKVMPELADKIDGVTGAYKGSREELDKLIQKQKEQMLLNAYSDNMTDLTKRQVEVQQQLDDVNAQWEDVVAEITRLTTRNETTGQSGMIKKLYGEGYSLADVKEMMATIDSMGYTWVDDWMGTGKGKKLTAKDFGKYGTNIFNMLDELSKSKSSLNKDLDYINDQLTYWEGKYGEAWGKIYEEGNEAIDDGIDNAETIIGKDKIPSALHKTLDKADETIKTDGKLSEKDMNNLFSAINSSFTGLKDGKVPEEVQRTMENIKNAILTNSPALISYMSLLRKQMENAFIGGDYDKFGNLIYNPNNITKRLGVDVGKIEESLQYGQPSKTYLKTLGTDAKEFFGGEMPKEVNDAYNKLAKTIENGEGVNAVYDALEKFKTKFAESANTIAQAAGMNFTYSLGYSIDKNGHFVYDAGYNLSLMAGDGVKDGGEISSPSKLFRRLGRFFPEGLALGIEDETPKAVSAIDGMLKDMKSTFTGVKYNVPKIDYGSNYSSNRFDYGNMDNNNSFVSRLTGVANSMAQNGQTEVVFRVEGDPYGIFKVVREENDKYRRQHSNRSAF